MKLRCLIIDDEVAARQGLSLLVSEIQDLELIGTCANGVEAIDQIRALRPDLILLDVQMPGISGFEVLNSLSKPWPHIIFITAHDQFALKAFEVSAVDYLLKPFSDERFAEAIDKVRKRQGENRQPLDDLIAQTRSTLKTSATFIDSPDRSDRLIIKADGSIHLLDLKEIAYVEAFDYYIKIHVNNRYFLLRETMKNIENRLPKASFLRVHKSSIVNLAHIQALHKLPNQEYAVELVNKTMIKVSRTFKSALLVHLK